MCKSRPYPIDWTPKRDSRQSNLRKSCDHESSARSDDWRCCSRDRGPGVEKLFQLFDVLGGPRPDQRVPHIFGGWRALPLLRLLRMGSGAVAEAEVDQAALAGKHRPWR